MKGDVNLPSPGAHLGCRRVLRRHLGPAWMAQLLRNQHRFPPDDGAPLRIPRSAPWLAAGVAVALLFVGVLGPGIRL